ncbi:MAG TPA: aminopeptidase [Chitinispirillaceae bacterium]|nr:aminopeptidase [Chitinispirillaceae bacterium]
MYTPSSQQLEKYAKVLINFALNDGIGIKKNDVVYMVTQTPGLPLAKEIYKVILRAGGHPILNIQDDDFKLLHLQEGTDEQLSFFPAPYYKGLADSIDHYVRILAEEDPLFLSKADPRKVILSSRSVKQFRDWLDEKEDAGKFTWTLCMYGTDGAAKEAGMSIQEYWEQINRACFLDEPDPIKKWQDVLNSMNNILNTLNNLPIAKVHVEAPQTDLWVGLGENRKWLGGRGRNIPSFEIFTSPDWREVEGTVFFDLPLYRYGNIIKDIKLEIKNGIITSAKAAENEKLLHEMLAQKNADKIGEFSLTDIRFSKINRFMANTLFDENFGGQFGNTHLAVGKAYHDACSLDPATMSNEDFAKLGYNDSPEHTDIIATTDRKVTAVLKDGSSKVIYEGGEFRL